MAKPRSKKPALTTASARRRPSLDFSLHGLIYICIMFFMGLAAINSGANLLYGVFGLMIGILIVAAVLSRRVLKKLVVHRVLPDHGVVGLPSMITYQFHNQKRFWPSLSITAAELQGADGFTKQPQGYMLHAAAGMTASVPTEAIPVRRGLHTFDAFQISTSFPFGFVRRAAIDRQPDKLLVFPPIGRVNQALLSLCRAAEHTGASMRPRPGGQDEFYGVKEHRAGDNPRHIHWRRSARTAASGILVAKEMTQVAPPRLLLLVDTWLTDKLPETFARVEKVIAMAASIVSGALEADLSVGLLAWAGDWKRIEPSRGKLHRIDLLSALARLPMNVTQDTGRLLDQGLRHTENGTTGVLITPRDMPPGLDQRRRGALVVVPTESEEAGAWFQWEPPVDFATCVPLDQVPPPAKARRQWWKFVWTKAS
jgi:uncharacterized protein (DUF58 family)